MAWVFWGCVALLAHTYVLYPLSLIAVDAIRQALSNLRFLGGAGDRRGRAEETVAPMVSVVIAAHNEAACMGEKLINSLKLDWPGDRLEIVVGSDGSTDATCDIVSRFVEQSLCAELAALGSPDAAPNQRRLFDGRSACADPRVVLSAAPRGGKVAVLNRCIPAARGEIVVLTDANTRIDAKALRKLTRHFRDPRVGAVCGRLRLFNPARRTYEESAYWLYESFIKFYEGKHGAVLGANGGIYAIRKSLFLPLAPETIVDDFVIPMRILQAGHSVLYDPEALAFEETTEDYQREAGRRARIAAGNFQSLRWVGALLAPGEGFVAYALWSHKLLRWVAPFLMIAAAASNLLLLTHRWAWLTLVAQLGFYGLAVGGARGLWRHGTLRRLGSVAHYFTRMNLALLVGFWRFARNSQGAAWERTAR